MTKSKGIKSFTKRKRFFLPKIPYWEKKNFRNLKKKTKTLFKKGKKVIIGKKRKTSF